MPQGLRKGSSLMRLHFPLFFMILFVWQFLCARKLFRKIEGYQNIDDTAKGIRLSVHIYANSSGEAIEQAFQTYLKARQTAMDNKIPLAPIENKWGPAT